jgi:hypothetical protein
MKQTLKAGGTLLVVAAIAVSLVNCGGSSGRQVAPPPPPSLTVATSSLPAGFYSEFYVTTLQATGGVGAKSWSISNGTLPQGLALDHSAGVITGIITDTSPTASSMFDITVQDAAAHTATKSLTISWSSHSPRILTTKLPDGYVGTPYSVTLATTVPSASLRWSTSSPDPLPPGLSLNGQILDGSPTTTGTYDFVLELLDSANAVADQRAFTVIIGDAGTGTGNNNISSATALSNGTYHGSISPFVDLPLDLSPNPDQDYYKFTAQPGNIVSIQIRAESLGSPMDSVIELVDSSGVRLNTCNAPGESGFISACLNDDDAEEGTHDSKLLFRAPSGAATTFFLHVVDWRGDARPDMIYTLQIFGAD